MFNRNFIGIILIVVGVLFFRSYQENNQNSEDLEQKPSINLKEENISSENKSKLSKDIFTNCIGENKNFSIEFFKTNNLGEKSDKGINHVIVFNPKSPELDFKVNVGLAHNIYAENDSGKLRKEYVPKLFREIIGDENALLNGKKPIAAINADYIDTDDKPQGLNISRGIEYSGDFKDKRSSFGVSGGESSQRQATIGVGRRNRDILNYNLVGGNGRFYTEGKFKDICEALGEFACTSAINRSMAAVTNQGYVILLVNDARANSDIEITDVNRELLPDMFDDVLEGIARNNCLGKVEEGILFDGGESPGLFYNNKTYVENLGAIGSVFLIYKK
ncbi:MAG: hypothetical protein ACFCUV_06390 [Rivularia sp. (in: cyanobacteria)]